MTYHVPMHARSRMQPDYGWSGLAIKPPANDPVPKARLEPVAVKSVTWDDLRPFLVSLNDLGNRVAEFFRSVGIR